MRPKYVHANPKRIQVLYEPEQYNPTCNCTIPGAWVAIPDHGPKFTCGDTLDETIVYLSETYPKAKIIR